MTRFTVSFAALAMMFTFIAGPAFAGDLKVENAKARVIVPTNPAAAYFTIKNAGDADKLIAVATPAYGRAEIHTHKMDGGVAKMLKVDAIDVPGKGEAALKSGGDHVMLFEPVKPMKVGDSFPLTLTFEKAGDVEVSVTVAPLKETMDHSAHQGHGGHSGHASHGESAKHGGHEKMDHGAHHKHH